MTLKKTGPCQNGMTVDDEAEESLALPDQDDSRRRLDFARFE